jgi:hypothetical protein
MSAAIKVVNWRLMITWIEADALPRFRHVWRYMKTREGKKKGKRKNDTKIKRKIEVHRGCGAMEMVDAFC